MFSSILDQISYTMAKSDRLVLALMGVAIVLAALTSRPVGAFLAGGPGGKRASEVRRIGENHPISSMSAKF